MIEERVAPGAAGSPDAHGAGLSAGPLDALRYDGQSDDPDEVAGMLHALMPSGVRVLDVGCGTGSVTLIANRGRGNDVRAIEPDPDRAAIAAARGIGVHRGMLDEAFIAEHGRFEVVMFADVLEHLPTPAALIDGAIAALAPDGIVLASVPNVAHWSVRLQLLFGRFEYAPVGIMDVTHLRWFTAASIRRLFEDRGLEVTVLRQTAGFDLPVYNRGLFLAVPRRLRLAMLRRLNRLLPLLFGCQHVLKARARK